MRSLNRKWWLAVVALLCLAPATLGAKPRKPIDPGCQPAQARRCRQVPEGGSALIYLLGVGITCAGAMLIRSRVATPSQS